ncbi:hypothetical protein Aperf_G00000110027 [Anoplocephala perfoliata]
MSRKANLESDSKYRAYSSAIEKCLKSFEYSNEWPDLISSLARLMKLIQQYDRYDVIPEKRLLSKRLAQCLHHALPPGVHCKTLECFDLIFRIMGPDNLAVDIGNYGPCLFGLLGPSAMTVKPLLFNIFETYLLPLGDRLKTSFVGLLQGLLPGLEEGSEFFERGNGIIEKFCRAIGPEFFYSSLWQVLIQAPSVRHFGTGYIINHFNKRRHLSAQAYIFGTSTAILLESVRCLLGDSVVLVQRDTLDFVILTLPVHLMASPSSPKHQVVFNQHPLEGKISPSEMRDLVAASLTVLLRKDASLNRRLFIWLLGSQNIESAEASQHATTVARMALPSGEIQNDSDSVIQQKYFKRFSLPMLTEALHTILKSTLVSSSVFDVHSGIQLDRNVCFRPFRLMSGLLNRSEIGSLLVEQVLVDFIFFTLHMYQRLGGDGGSSSGSEKSQLPSPSLSVTSSPTQRRVQDRDLPQQTVEMLVQYESYADNSGNRNTGTGDVNSEGPNHHTRRRSFRFSNNRRLRISRSNDINTKSVGSPTINVNSTRPSTEAEFMREAELFFSNLESGFLWPFLQEHFFLSSTKVHPGWISAVRFLLEHLPVDTYPDVRGCHLPRMVSAVSKSMCERMGQLSLADISEFVDLLGVLIGYIQEHMVTMLDQSLAEVSRPSTVGSLRVSSTSAQVDMEIQLIAGIVGDMRHLLAVFFKQYLTSASSNVVEECIGWLRSPEKNLHAVESEFREFMNPKVPERDRAAVVDLLAQLCRLIVDMCNVPIVQPSESSSENFDFNKLFNSGPGEEKNSLPDWLACLVAGSALSTDFDTKAICLHTVLDLVEASTSIHGWTSCVAPNDNHLNEKQMQWGPSGLLLPVLAMEVLSIFASTLDFFPLAAVSLWSFMNDSTYAEDAASLIIRVLTVSPNNEFTSTEALVEDFFVQQMLSPHPHLRLEARQRFALLWKFLRRPPSATGVENPPSNSGGPNCDSPALSSSMTGWRRAAMGLPPIANEIASDVPNFNRCLLILLDSLEELNPNSGGAVDVLSKSDSSTASAIPEAGELLQAEIQQTTTAWLISALSSGQAGRVVAPLFSTLLHPSVARASLTSIRNRRRRQWIAKKRRARRRLRQTGEVQTPSRKSFNAGDMAVTKDVPVSGEETEDGDCYEDFDTDLDGDDDDDYGDDEWEEYDRNICALSGGSPSGELHFYVTKNKSQNQTSPKEPEKRKKRLGVFAKTPILRRKKKGAEESDVFDEEYHPVDVMTRLQSEGRNNDTGVDDRVERISLDRVRRDIIQGLLSDLLKSEPGGGKAPDLANLSSFDRLVASPVKILPVHEHLLVYLHKYDFNQVKYAFSRLRAILKTDAGSLFLLALAATPTMGKKFTNSISRLKQDVPYFATCEFPKLFGTSLSDLLARHYRCLFGGGREDFTRQATADEMNVIFDLRMPSLLDVLLHICISFLLSLILPSSSSQSSLDSAANANVRLLAAEVLQLITEKLLYLSQILISTGDKNVKLDTRKGDAEMIALVSALCESNLSWIDTVIQRSGLPQAVLHSLATFTEMSQLIDSSHEEEGSLPLCMRLLKPNIATEGSSMLWILLQITSNLLQLTEPRYQPQTKSSIVAPTSAAVGRGGRNSPSTEAAPTLPWCASTASNFDAVTLKSLAARKFSPALLALLATSYVDGSLKVGETRLRHIATQSLLLNTIRLALTPTARVDLHPLWFGFLRKTLIHWGSATALLINTVISQMTIAIQMLAEPFCHALMPVGMTERLLPSDYPAGYALQLFACLQGIVHTYLLPFGQSKSTLLHGMILGTTAFTRDGSPLTSSKPSPAHRGKLYNNSSSFSKVNGLIYSVFDTPEALRDSLRVAEALEDYYHSVNQTDYPPLVQTLQRMQLNYLEDPAVPSNLASAATLLFTTKDFLGTEVMPLASNRVQNWARGRAEMCHDFPALLSSLAAIWLALNQSSDPRNSQLSIDDPDNSSIETGVDALNGDTFIANSEFSLRLRCGFDRLAALTILGYPDVVRQTIRDLLEPIASTHPALLLGALAYVWPSLLSPAGNGVNMDVMWLLSSSPAGLPMTVRQCALVSLISGACWSFQEIGNGTGRYVAVSNLSINEDIEKPVSLLKTPLALKTLHSLLRSPPASMAYAYSVDLSINEIAASSSPDMGIVPSQMIQSSLLHFLYAWIVATGGIAGSSFHLAGVQDFLRDVVPLTSVSAAISTTSGLGTAITSPVSIFVLVKIFNEIIVKLANKDEKRDQKDLQDICQRLMEAAASIAGTALEQANWFRRGLQVRSYATAMAPLTSSTLETSSSVGARRTPDLMLHPTASESALSEIKLNGVNTPPGGVLQDSQEGDSTAENRDFKAEDLSVLALRILAEHMAVFFDVVYKSDEKDRVPSALNNGILPNILPFLKSHNISNAFHYNAASQVLASLSSYQFTRRAWRRDVFELFIDATFFQAMAPALHSWRAVVDNLMTQEKNAFKEALTRLTVSQGTGLNLFSSKEAEYEQRAANLKKISFIVFASERDQYSRSVPEILERLTDNLRATTDQNVPILTQLFLCTRVLVARISSESLASLWLIVIPELTNVFQIFAESFNGSSRKRSALKFEDLQKLPQSQLALLLSASKLLATILLLPESTVPQLLFHRWVFVNRAARTSQDVGVEEETNEPDDAFHPLMSQISSGLASLYQNENQIYATQLLSLTNACYFILSTKSVTDFEPLELFFRSLGEKRRVAEASSEVLDDVGLNTLNQVFEVSTFNEFPEPLMASK